MIKLRWTAALCLVVACSGGGAGSQPVAPVTSPQRAVENFMQAVADSNLERMATLWGGTGGPASQTRQPPDYERRIAVMQAYLQNESHRIMPTAGSAGEARQDLQVELRRGFCTWVVPFTTVKLADGNWLVNQVDLTKAGNPARPCDPGGAPDTTAAE